MDKPPPSRQTGPAATAAEDLRAEMEARALLARHRGRPAINAAPAVAKILRTVVPLEARADGPTLKDLTRRWADIVGPMLAAHTRPEKRSRGPDGDTLVLRVSPSAGPMVQSQSKALLERINLYAGGGRFTRLALNAAPMPRRAPPTKRVARALDAAEEADIDQQVAGIEDERLRNALAGLGKAMAARIAP